MNGWSDAGGNSQAEQEAEVKVILWTQSDFPARAQGMDDRYISSDGMPMR